MQALLTNDQIKFMLDREAIKDNETIMSFNKLPKTRIFRLHHTEFIDEKYYFWVYDIDNHDRLYRMPSICLEMIEDMPADRMLEAYAETDEEMNIVEVEEKTDVEKKVLGKKKAKINGITLTEGMKIILHNDKTDKYNNKTLTVRDTGLSIKLIAPRGRPKKK